ncbi:efflux transporter outer membrane subunit [Vibrio splendidus]|uniref:efflux transporter outer membrane subunit n=1 Tax=Vibrio splendidus TaxID=29497 RepID=UPI0024688DAD|nr:efflux transporter outer membrane subunit [Vibrio splendidus]MDH5911498.1 efflux transporter outer membrane subunit [Vibrio splendidus]MDH5942717.1 efflux transporter outer membrane subunit [Vibrio splendidus]MDH5985736.1 efflux transporter outer membrane subunit [Vibrio splendidus]MDH5994294.1 efflux transporter outer membrane subunit [Vibrio splendidus]MDH6006704.1 efflux transporter outer membrane subunit [Vibrio splendidus]
MKLRKLSPVLLSLILAGCAVGPNYEAPQDVVGNDFLYSDVQGVTESDQVVQSEWWLAFDDAMLNQLVEQAQQQNITLKIAAERIKTAQSYQKAIESFKVPTIGLSAGATSYQISENDPLAGPLVSPGGLGPQVSALTGGDALIDNQYEFATVSANITWEADVFNRLGYKAESAEIRAEQAQILKEGMTTLITADVIHNYLQYRGAEQRKILALETIESQKQTLKLVQSVVRSGYGSELDLAQAKAALSMTRSVMPQLDIAQSVHKQRLAILLGETSADMNQMLTVSTELADFSGVVPIGLPSDVLKNRPDIQIAEREMAAINADVGAAIANKYPKFYLTGSPGLLAGDFSDLFSSDSAAWVASVGVNWTIFDGGRSDALVEIQESRFQTAALSYEQSVNTAITEVETLLYAYGSSQELQSLVADTRVQSDSTLNKANSLYKAGLVDYMTVLDAQRQQNLVKDREIAASLQTSQVIVGLHKALGGNWEVPQSTETQEATQTN